MEQVGFSSSHLTKFIKRFRCYYSSGSRPKVSAHQWAMGRVKSFVTGKGGARKADSDLIKKQAEVTESRIMEKILM